MKVERSCGHAGYVALKLASITGSEARRFNRSGWHHAATLELQNEAAGFQGASVVDYDLDYFVTVASEEFALADSVLAACHE